MSNANRDYAIVYDVKNSSLVLSRPLNFYITDKNTSNIFIKLVTRVTVGNGIDQYTDIENASNYVLTMRVIKPNNEVKSLEATQHEPENIFQFDLTEDFKDIPGKYICELTISTIVSGRQELITSDPFNYEVKRSILSNVGEIIETEDTTVEKLLNNLDVTKAELSSQIKEKANLSDVANGLTAKGNCNYANLPTSGNKIGDYWYCDDASIPGNYVWNGTSWYFGGTGNGGFSDLKEHLYNTNSDFKSLISDYRNPIEISYNLQDYGVTKDGNTIKTIETTLYKTQIINVNNNCVYLNASFKKSKSTGYPYYIYFVDDNENIIENYEEPATVDSSNKIVSCEYEIPPNCAKIYILTYTGSNSNNLYLKAYISEVKSIKDLIDSSDKNAIDDTIINDSINKMLSHNKEHECLNFAFITDTHVGDECDNGNVLLSLNVFNLLSTTKYLDFCCHGGDLFDAYEYRDSGQGITHDKAIERLNMCMNIFKDIQIPLYIARGNHDLNFKYVNNNNEKIPEEKITDVQWKILTQNNFKKDYNGNLGHSFYKDFDDKKIRVIVLDVYLDGTESAGYRPNLAQWLCSEALKLNEKNNYSVFIIAHIPMLHIEKIINAFQTGTNCSDSELKGVQCDFTSQGVGKFAGMLCGHTHNDAYNTDNGYNYISCTTGYLKTSGDVVCSIFSIDTTNRKIYETRIGLGSDREFDY